MLAGKVFLISTSPVVPAPRAQRPMIEAIKAAKLPRQVPDRHHHQQQ
ncbi:hypothetical protein H2136_07740 [Aeromonas hydrophila]|uniref:Uncharacterized protein n=1 Tax=Aeromonas hydrophila TaxID=644 RepID=A0A926FN93_AERHY|nr:hypothetical protein [Aeromonas hydrophila]